jgi:hypothetical protein
LQGSCCSSSATASTSIGNRALVGDEIDGLQKIANRIAAGGGAAWLLISIFPQGKRAKDKTFRYPRLQARFQAFPGFTFSE